MFYSVFLKIKKLYFAENINKDKQNPTSANKKKESDKRKNGQKDKTLKSKANEMSFLPNSGVDIELSNESKQKIRKRSDYKIRLKFSEDSGKRLNIINIKYLLARNI